MVFANQLAQHAHERGAMTMPNPAREEIRNIQHALAQKGFDPGIIDGVWGRRTEGALRAFQQDRGLQVDGIPGPITRAALFGSATPVTPQNDPGLPWFQEARRLLGVREDTGPGSTRTILDWAGDLGIPYKSDDIPWCGLFVAHCIGSTLTREPLPNNPLGARNWSRFGAPSQPKVGAIMVFWRVTPTSGKGHVGFYAAEDDAAYHILGGNQSDKVSIARVAKSRLVGARWPSTVSADTGAPLVIAAGDDALSGNEA
jgi:uncharacterized protein (TIGR02594 family)